MNTKNILNKYVKGLEELIGEPLKSVILYGSYARGDESKNNEVSDIDMMIIVDTDEAECNEIQQKVLDYSYDWDLEYNILLSPMVETLENYNKRTKFVTYYENVKKDGILLNV